MTMLALLRQVKNIVVGYTEAEIKVRNATSNDPQEPSQTLMLEIANLTFHVRTFREVMGMVWYRLSDSGKNWRHVYKALILVECLLKNGSQQVRKSCRHRISIFQLLQNFQFVDHRGNDRGPIVREKARQLECLLRDNVCSPTSSNASDLKEAQPKTSAEEELQLQMALAMSMEESEKSANLLDNAPSSEAPPQPSDPSEQPKDDPWDAIPIHCNVPVMGSPWTVLPSPSITSNP